MTSMIKQQTHQIQKCSTSQSTSCTRYFVFLVISSSTFRYIIENVLICLNIINIISMITFNLYLVYCALFFVCIMWFWYDFIPIVFLYHFQIMIFNVMQKIDKTEKILWKSWNQHSISVLNISLQSVLYHRKCLCKGDFTFNILLNWWFWWLFTMS